MREPEGATRLLPWSTVRGRPCFLVSDGTGYVSRLADSVEAVRLGMANELLGHAADLLKDHRATAIELHFLALRLTESLRDVLRIAESQGARLGGGAPKPPSGEAR
ncbi:hypothetical protein [Streptomyces halobius]